MIPFVCGFGLCALIVLAMEIRSRRPRRHALRGNYFDARAPFVIAGRGADAAPERSEELIARTARRLTRGRQFPILHPRDSAIPSPLRPKSRNPVDV